MKVRLEGEKVGLEEEEGEGVFTFFKVSRSGDFLLELRLLLLVLPGAAGTSRNRTYFPEHKGLS